MGERLFEGKEHAAAYVKYRVSPDELVGKIVDFMEKKRGKPFSLAVDVGCGSGQGTILLAPHFTQVVGTDISHAQLEMALANGNPPNVSYRQCPAEELPFADGEVDLVSAMTAAHWFDRQRFFREAERVLRPGGCLALLSYSMHMELEYGDISGTLNHIFKEFYAALLPYRSARIGMTTLPIYQDMYDSCLYPDKQWNECFWVRRPMALTGYLGMVETFSSYQKLQERDPAEAQRLSSDIKEKLLTAMGVSSPETEVVVVIKYWYWMAHKP